MPKFTVCVTKTIQVFDHFEVEADNDMQARSKAVSIAKLSDSMGTLKNTWTQDEKPIYKAEVSK